MIVVGLSGGVDSAVAALLLRQQGLEIEGLFMANWEEDDAYCTISADYQDALAVCRELRIPLHRVDFAAEYRQRVFDYFLTEYRAGRTPNPDVLCNREIKFGVCLEHVRRLGGTRFATGHYARRIEGPGGVELHKATDRTKDQSYFLHSLERAQLEAAMFPLGELSKLEVRERARSAGLPVHDKPDSTGICFIGERPFRDFLARYLPRQPGEIRVHGSDRVVGSHQGLMYYTLGQREGLGIGGVRGAPEEPWFAAAKDMAANVLYVVQGHDHPALQSASLVAQDLSWVSGRAPHTHWVYASKTRYRQPDAACQVERVSADECEVVFAAPQWAVTPGQSLVLYESRVCLGGGIIATSRPWCA